MGQQALGTAPTAAWIEGLGEPEWLRDARRQAARMEERLDWPHWDRRTSLEELRAVVDASPGTGGVHLELPEALRDQGIVLLPLSLAAAQHGELFRRLLGRQIPAEAGKLEALNLAAMQGCLLVVPDGVVAESPIEIVYRLPEGSGVQFHPRTMISVGRTAEVSVVQRTEGAAHGDVAVVTEVVEAEVADGGILHFSEVQNWPTRVRAWASRQAELGRDARVQWTIGELGSGLMRGSTTTILRGIGSEALSLVVFFASGQQHMDLTTQLVHIGSRTNGQMLARGVLAGSARTVYRGTSDIKRGAKDSNSQQKEQTLHLTAGVRSDAIPALYIDENELQAGHAATTGKVDPEHLFYLRSRGLPLREAERLIVQGFFAPLVERIPLEGVRREITSLVDRKIDGEEG